MDFPVQYRKHRNVHKTHAAFKHDTLNTTLQHLVYLHFFKLFNL